MTTGTIKGAISAGTTAYTIPKIDEYLKEQGFDETTRQTALLTLSAGIGATVGGDTTANNAGQVQWNYLLHSQMDSWEKALAKCTNDACRRNTIQEYLKLSDEQQKNLEKVCVANYNALQCESLRQKYFSLDETLTDTNPSKLGGINIDQQNKEAEAVWIDIARSNPNTSSVNQLGWMVHDNGGFGGRSGGAVGAVAVGSGRKSVNPSRSNSQNQRDLDPVLKNGYIFKHGVDIDLRNTGKTQKDALDLAFQKTGVSRSEFSVTKWAKGKNGKSFPVEYRVLSEKNRGAEVNIDIGHTKQGTLGSPHIGWQTPGKNNIVGHIFVDKVDVHRVR
ncbi:polymorphic toxin type 47 domain-containing protein [Moraxella nasicaprae]|uniref:Polymorphic toxin type 47 domain-containing protein n=1 Tax=Moraxella nasicaprae TaxID=2904122 RepID=A0ABY6F3Z3_9GAMM|nr:polymorphic toxin type 47 domain-containing protein [Moraxella nasicaprae]UXZ04810.1 polymorphic toxin type 47 domain-containing protein [Moraxella nasicaprae]